MARTEWITRGNCPPAFELAPGVDLRIFVSGTQGAKNLFTGTGTFRPGAGLSYHIHPCSEAVTLLSGRAHYFVEGRRYLVGPYDAVHIPAGTPHSVRNASDTEPFVLLSAFASEAPTRELVEDRFQVVDRTTSDASCPETLMRFESAPVYELSPGALFRDLFARRFGAR